MSDAAVALLPRQMGLVRSVDMAANNIANASTPGYKAEGAIFAEHVARTGAGEPSLSMGHLAGHATDFTAGSLEETGGTFDLALGGPGFFKVATEGGERLTRAGVFTTNADGVIVDVNGFALLDAGGGEIQIPPDAMEVAIARDGTMSIDGEAFSDIGVHEATGEPTRAGSNYWISRGDRAVEEPVVLQGFIERSNVSPVAEFAALISTQRQFEAGQTLVEQEHERLSALIAAIRQG